MPIRDLAGDAVRSVIRAYHGSPHDFDKFDASKIGTGEGAQAYGYGLYFAGDEGIANDYRRRLAGEEIPESLLLDGVPHHAAWNDAGYPERDGIGRLAGSVALRPDHLKASYIEELRRTAEERVLSATEAFEEAKRWANPTELFDFERQVADAAALATVFRKYKSITPKPAVRPGKTYEVEIGFPEAAMLDWDAPMSRQPKNVQRAFGDLAMDMPGDGGRVYRDIFTRHGEAFDDDMTGTMAAREASREMLAEGVPGIRYLDGASRRAGEGTRNYVMFPGTEDSITILRKYGLLPATFAAEGLLNQPRQAESKGRAF